MHRLTALFDREDAIDAELFDAVRAQNAARKSKDAAQIALRRETIRRLQTEKKQAQKEAKALMDAFAKFNRAAKPYHDAKRLLKQKENYGHFDEIAAKYEEAKKATTAPED